MSIKTYINTHNLILSSYHMQSYFPEAIDEVSQDFVCIYKFDIAAFEADPL